MTVKIYNLDRRMSVILNVAAILTTSILLSFPFRMLIADYCYNRVDYILDNKSTERWDLLEISEDTMIYYTDSIKSLKNAAAIVPSKSIYFKALADIYIRLGKWAEVMKMVNAPLPQNAVPEEDAYNNAVTYLKNAISLEPTNPDYHLALGELYNISSGNAMLAGKEFSRAIKAYPINAPLRYVIAKQYLLSGMTGDALEQARVLASIDDGYLIPDSIRGTLMSERRTPEYLIRISNSYFFKAMEIAWRVTKDPEVIKGITPDNADAMEVARLFLETKGIYE